MIKQVWVAQCDLCGKMENARIVPGRYNEQQATLPIGWSNGYSKDFHCCPECSKRIAKEPVGKTEQDAADAWNERASQPMPPSVIDALEKMADHVFDWMEMCYGCPAYGCGMENTNASEDQCKNAIAKAMARAAGWEV